MDGMDEDIALCKSKNVFAKQATIKCNESFRPDKYWIEIMAIRCDGKPQCKNGIDEFECDIPTSSMFGLLAISFGIISIVAGQCPFKISILD